jgi:hypothetical protein
VKDGGALYDFAGQGQNHKRGANSLTQQRTRRNDEASGRTRPKHTKHLDFQPHNPLKFKREGSREKLDAYKNSLILRLNL